MNFEEFMNIVYMLKLLYEVDQDIFSVTVDLRDLHFNPEDGYYYDCLYETMIEICENLFEYVDGEYYEMRGLNITIYSDPIIEEYFRLAGEYGEKNGIAEDKNPFFEEAEEEMRRNFNFSYSLDWVLKGHAKPEREYQSRFALLSYEYDYVDLCGMVIGLLRMCKFFREGVQTLQEMLEQKETFDTKGALAA